jgi:hypothetical protein
MASRRNILTAVALLSVIHNADGLDDLTRHRICTASLLTETPEELIRGIVEGEQAINGGSTRRIQNITFEALLKMGSPAFWEDWRKRNELVAHASASVRLASNKWPAELWTSGYVQSFGPGQITPRTAFLACGNNEGRYAMCRLPTDGMLRALVGPSTAYVMVGIVFAYEREEMLRVKGVDLRENPIMWATVYNVGGDYFRATYESRWGYTPNILGRWVGKHSGNFKNQLRCESYPPNSR